MFTEEMMTLALAAKFFAPRSDDSLQNSYCFFCKLRTKLISLICRGLYEMNPH